MFARVCAPDQRWVARACVKKRSVRVRLHCASALLRPVYTMRLRENFNIVVNGVVRDLLAKIKVKRKCRQIV